MTKAKEKQPDSLTHHEERSAKMRAEAKEQAEDKEIASSKELIREGETRDELLERIRQMRTEETKPVEPAAVLGISPYQQSIREIEEQAGREAVARAEKQMAEARKMREEAEKERLKREGEMKEVHHPNPSQNEQFPAQGATLGKTKK